ncbi:MAG: DUF192 domain-containing protein [Candidatus Moraniibacteriota bacterium]
MNQLTSRSKQGLLILGGVLLVCLIVLSTRLSSGFDPRGSIFPTHAFANGKVWQLEIANTDALRTLGLGERDMLPKEKGMLFLFDARRPYGFWMKGMRFPLDIVFLVQGEIIFIERGIQPDDPKVVLPPKPIDQVLELNAGEAASLSIGDRIRYWRAF